MTPGKNACSNSIGLLETDPRSVSPSAYFSGIHGWRACAALILAYCNNPQDVDWSDIQGALEEALKAFDMPPDFPERSTG